MIVDLSESNTIVLPSNMVRTKQGALVDFGVGADGEVPRPKQFARKSTGGKAARMKLLSSKSAKKSSASKDKGWSF